MKNSKHLQWLYRELPALMNAGVISAETADKLHNYYSEIKEGNKSRTAKSRMIFPVRRSGVGITLSKEAESNNSILNGKWNRLVARS